MTLISSNKHYLLRRQTLDNELLCTSLPPQSKLFPHSLNESHAYVKDEVPAGDCVKRRAGKKVAVINEPARRPAANIAVVNTATTIIGILLYDTFQYQSTTVGYTANISYMAPNSLHKYIVTCADRGARQ